MSRSILTEANSESRLMDVESRILRALNDHFWISPAAAATRAGCHLDTARRMLRAMARRGGGSGDP